MISRGKKKKTPPKPIDLLAISSRKYIQNNVNQGVNILPPLPAVPLVPLGSPDRLRSPHDNTQILINGLPVQMNDHIDSRINGEEKIKPLTPVNNFNENRFTEPVESNLSPNKYIDSNIKIMDTPVRQNYNDNDNDSDKESEYIEEISESLNQQVLPEIPSIKPVEIVQKDESKLKIQGKNMKSLLPTIKPFDKNKINIDPEFLENGEEPKIQAFSPVNIPYPVFENSIRAISPIQTLGPKSPGISKPVFNEEGKSFTPIRAVTPQKPASVKASTPPPIFRSPKRMEEDYKNKMTPVHLPVNNENNIPLNENEFKNLYNQYKHYHEQLTPQAPENLNIQSSGYYTESQNKVSNRPNYSRISREQSIYLRQEFKVKFGILRSTYPQWEVVEPNDSLSLDQIHDLYDHYLKQILISRESGNYKTYMVIFLMVIEVIGVRFLKLNMSGYTLSQLRIMNRYDALFTELGEKYLVSNGSNWPVEARIVMMMLFNAVIFLVVRYLCSWMGMEAGIADTLQSMIDGMLNGPSMLSTNSGPIGSSNPIPDPVSFGAPSTTPESGNTIDKIADMFGTFMNKNGGGITEKIAELGTMFTKKTQNSNNVQKQKEQVKEKVKEKDRKKINKKKLFDD